MSLLEYDNIEGMILLSELSRRRIRSINKLIRVGKQEVRLRRARVTLQRISLAFCHAAQAFQMDPVDWNGHVASARAHR